MAWHSLRAPAFSYVWPILGLLISANMKEPVVIGLHCGPKKNTAFLFENYLHKMKFVRKPEYPLTQVIRRPSEVKQHIVKNTGLVCPLKKQHFVGLILSGFSVTAQYQEM
jgi:hypothetical protein